MRFIVDFHAVDSDAVLVTTLDEVDFAGGAVRTSWGLVGADALLDDAEGHTARGLIRAVSAEGLVEIDIDWTSWRDHTLPGANAMFAWGRASSASVLTAGDASGSAPSMSTSSDAGVGLVGAR